MVKTNIFNYYSRPELQTALWNALKSGSQPSDYDCDLEGWLKNTFTDNKEYSAVISYLRDVKVLDIDHSCHEWFEQFSLGSNIEEEMGKDENDEPVFYNSIQLTTLGQEFILSLFFNHIKPNLC